MKTPLKPTRNHASIIRSRGLSDNWACPLLATSHATLAWIARRLAWPHKWRLGQHDSCPATLRACAASPGMTRAMTLSLWLGTAATSPCLLTQGSRNPRPQVGAGLGRMVSETEHICSHLHCVSLSLSLSLSTLFYFFYIFLAFQFVFFRSLDLILSNSWLMSRYINHVSILIVYLMVEMSSIDFKISDDCWWNVRSSISSTWIWTTLGRSADDKCTRK